MLCAIVVFNITHPSSIVKGPGAQLPGFRTLWRKGFKNIGNEDGEELLMNKSPSHTRV